MRLKSHHTQHGLGSILFGYLKQVPQPIGWGFLLVIGSLILGFPRNIESNLTIALLGFCLGMAGYWGLLRFLWRSEAPRVLYWKIGILLLACGLRIAMLPIQVCDDTYRYAWEAKVERAGFSSAQLAPSDSRLVTLRDKHFPLINHPDVPTVYPRVAQWFFRLGFPENPEGSANFFRWKSLLILIDLMAILLLAQHSWPAALTYGLHPLLLFEGVGRGHFEPIGITLLILAWLALRSRKDLGLGLAVALAISIKPIAAVMVVPWFFTQPWLRWRAYLAALLMGLSLWDVLATTGATLSQFLGHTQYHSLLPGLWQWMMGLFQEKGVYGNTGAWLTPVALTLGVIWIFLAYKRQPRAWPPERISLWMFGLVLVSATVFHPWYILWVLPFAALLGNSFWIHYAGMQILGLIPYYRQFLGHPWHEFPGLKWFMIAVPILIWLLLPKLRHLGPQQDKLA